MKKFVSSLAMFVSLVGMLVLMTGCSSCPFSSCDKEKSCSTECKTECSKEKSCAKECEKECSTKK